MAEKKIVMIIDDDTDDRMFFHEALDKLMNSYECREATNGEDALNQLRTSASVPDFIFLDLNMPLMDGNQCLTELKNDARLKKTPVIIYSTSSYDRDVEHTRELGASHFLTKVSSISNLPNILVRAMEVASRDNLLK